jgi:hypothetical protein
MIVGLLFSPNVFGYKVAVVRAEKGTTGVGCDPGDGTAGVDSTFPGPKLKWANTNITYSVNASGLDDLSSDTASQAIAAALSAWTQNSGGILQFNPAPPSNPPASSNPYPCDVGTGSVIFMWSKDNNIVPRDANAITWVKYNKATGEIIGAVVVFNQGRVLMASQYSTSDIFSEQVVWTIGKNQESCGFGFQCTSYLDVQAIATHEIGHVVGLKHNDEVYKLASGKYEPVPSPPYALMRTGGSGRSLQLDDVNGLNSLYPPPGQISTFGTVSVIAKYNGNPWSGNMNYYVTCPFRQIIGLAIPSSTQNVPTGQCTLTYNSGGPSTTLPPVVLPATSQTLGANQTLTFELDFRSANTSPIAGFTMTSQGQTKTDGQTLGVSVASGGTATVQFDASARTQDPGGTVSTWNWTIDGVPVVLIRGPQPSFSQALTIGNHTVSLIVSDNWGMQSAAVQGTIAITQSASAAFNGSWINTNSLTQDITRIQFRADTQNIYAHMWGKCHPIDCDMQEASTPLADGSDGVLSLTWTFSFATEAQTVTALADGRLQVVTNVHYTDNSGREDYAYTGYFLPGGDPNPQAGFFITIAGTYVYSGDTASFTSSSGLQGTFDGLANTYQYGPGGVTQWQWSDNGVAIPSGTANVSNFTWQLAIGTHNLALIVTDTRGLRSAAASATVVVNVPAPISGSCTVNGQSTPVTLQVGNQATFVVSATGGTLPLHYAWNGISGNDSNAASQIYSAAGTYDVSAVVSDSAQTRQQTTVACPRVTVSAPPALSAFCNISPSPINLGAGSTLTAGAVGGKPPYQFLLPGSGSYGSANSVAVFPQQVGTVNYQVTAKDSSRSTNTGSCSVTVNGIAPTISNFGWYSQPRNNVFFSGYVNGSGFVSSSTVYFCASGTSTCWQQPPALVTIYSLGSIGVSNVNLTTGSWQIEVRTPYGTARSGSFAVSP